jgi:hypothetical protein
VQHRTKRRDRASRRRSGVSLQRTLVGQEQRHGGGSYKCDEREPNPDDESYEISFLLAPHRSAHETSGSWKCMRFAGSERRNPLPRRVTASGLARCPMSPS